MKFKGFRFVGFFMLFGGFLAIVMRSFLLNMSRGDALYAVITLMLGCLFLSLEED